MEKEVKLTKRGEQVRYNLLIRKGFSPEYARVKAKEGGVMRKLKDFFVMALI